jgi:hypothetical protein
MVELTLFNGLFSSVSLQLYLKELVVFANMKKIAYPVYYGGINVGKFCKIVYCDCKGDVEFCKYLLVLEFGFIRSELNLFI